MSAHYGLNERNMHSILDPANNKDASLSSQAQPSTNNDIDGAGDDDSDVDFSDSDDEREYQLFLQQTLQQQAGSGDGLPTVAPPATAVLPPPSRVPTAAALAPPPIVSSPLVSSTLASVPTSSSSSPAERIRGSAGAGAATTVAAAVTQQAVSMDGDEADEKVDEAGDGDDALCPWGEGDMDVSAALGTHSRSSSGSTIKRLSGFGEERIKNRGNIPPPPSSLSLQPAPLRLAVTSSSPSAPSSASDSRSSSPSSSSSSPALTECLSAASSWRSGTARQSARVRMDRDSIMQQAHRLTDKATNEAAQRRRGASSQGRSRAASNADN